jgi:uridylate kinase
MPSERKRVLIKLSGDALSGSQGYGIDKDEIKRFGNEITNAYKAGMQIGVVVGGGNILRGAEASASGADRVAADHMGMLATVINGLAIKDNLEQQGLKVVVMSSIAMQGVCDSFSRNEAEKYLSSGIICVFVGGTGNPFFTTDSAAALRAIEIGADVLYKATKVNGIYDKDPKKHDDAIRYDKISYSEVIEKQLKVMDTAAIALSMENKLPIVVFDFTKSNQLSTILDGNETNGTLVYGDNNA